MDIGTITVIVAAALAISEALALIPGVESNSIFQMVWRILKLLAGEKKDTE